MLKVHCLFMSVDGRQFRNSCHVLPFILIASAYFLVFEFGLLLTAWNICYLVRYFYRRQEFLHSSLRTFSLSTDPLMYLNSKHLFIPNLCWVDPKFHHAFFLQTYFVVALWSVPVSSSPLHDVVEDFTFLAQSYEVLLKLQSSLTSCFSNLLYLSL